MCIVKHTVTSNSCCRRHSSMLVSNMRRTRLAVMYVRDCVCAFRDAHPIQARRRVLLHPNRRLEDLHTLILCIRMCLTKVLHRSPLLMYHQAVYIPAQSRKNLTVTVDALVSRVVTEQVSGKGKAIAVEFLNGDKTYSVKVGREVILSAGYACPAFNRLIRRS
jgi:hypothetical protein